MTEKTIIRQMLETQDKLNKATIGPEWRSEKHDFCLAILMECAEGIEHIGYKWWAKQERTMDGAMGEAVDILHFALAQLIREQGLDNDVAENYIAASIEVASGNKTIYFHERAYNLVRCSTTDVFRLISGLASAGQISFPALFALSNKLGMPAQTFFRRYFCKAVLNQFRQDHGYKDGSYKKLWWGKEDNHYIRKAADALDWTSGAAPYKLYSYLEVTYEKAVRGEDEPTAGRN